MLEPDAESTVWGSGRGLQIFDRELTVELSAVPISRLPTVSRKFSQRIAAVHVVLASTLLFLNALVLLKIYLRLWGSLMLLSTKE